MDVAEAMYGDLKQINPRQKRPNLKSWADTVRLMRERDKLSHGEIRSMWALARDDDFWRKNILSPDKLRKKWDDLIQRGFQPVDPNHPEANNDWILNAWAYEVGDDRLPKLKPGLTYGEGYQLEAKPGWRIEGNLIRKEAVNGSHCEV